MPKPVLICCHDAGAAEVVASWVKRHPRQNFVFLIEGPAIKVFQRRLGEVRIDYFSEVISSDRAFSKVVTGTSWSSDLEKRVRSWARLKKIRTETFLDAWVNYRVRFEVNGKLELPDEIFVYDEKAKELAARDLPGAFVSIVDNPHWEDVLNEVRAWESGVKSEARSEKNSKIRLLFVSQPISDVAKRITGKEDGYGYTEFSALTAFVEWLKPRLSEVEEFRLRVHPSETKTKYDSYFNAYFPDLNVSISSNEDLTRDLAWADWVVGMDTMAMVLALKTNKKVFSCIPAGGRQMEIPLPGIVRLFG